MIHSIILCILSSTLLISALFWMEWIISLRLFLINSTLSSSLPSYLWISSYGSQIFWHHPLVIQKVSIYLLAVTGRERDDASSSLFKYDLRPISLEALRLSLAAGMHFLESWQRFCLVSALPTRHHSKHRPCCCRPPEYKYKYFLVRAKMSSWWRLNSQACALRHATISLLSVF